MEKQGFYKVGGEQLLFAPNRVEHKDYILVKEAYESYSYPVEGWYWFNSQQEAEDFFVTKGWVKPQDETSE